MHFARFGLVGLIVAATAGVGLASQAPGEQAAEMLARAQTIDLKCHYLTAGERDQMSTVVAKAELALASQESTDDTKAAMARGHDAGMAAACSNKEQEAVGTILHAAIDASTADITSKEPAAQISQPPAAAQAQAAQMTGWPQVTPYVAKARPVAVAATKGSDQGLVQYASLTEQYYVARRCGGRSAGNLYQSIVSLHDELMQSHSAAAISAALHQAESSASAKRCS